MGAIPRKTPREAPERLLQEQEEHRAKEQNAEPTPARLHGAGGPGGFSREPANHQVSASSRVELIKMGERLQAR